MRTYNLRDGTVINLECVQSISPITTDGYTDDYFTIQFNNHWIHVRDKRGIVESERDALIVALELV